VLRSMESAATMEEEIRDSNRPAEAKGRRPEARISEKRSRARDVGTLQRRPIWLIF
jgi:hypothetical protein